MKKKTKKKIVKGSLWILTSFLLISIAYLDANLEKDNNILLSYNDTNIFTNVLDEELINTLEKSTGVFLFVNKKTDINKYVDLLYEVNKKEHIYLYNVKNDEIELKLIDNKVSVVEEPTDLYKKLIKYLGSYAEDYTLVNSNNELVYTRYKKIYTPMVLFIKNGRILYSYSLLEDINDETLLKIYKEGYETLKEYKG